MKAYSRVQVTSTGDLGDLAVGEAVESSTDDKVNEAQEVAAAVGRYCTHG